jgi:ParB-like chromosome segregation protein Spo0J
LKDHGETGYDKMPINLVEMTDEEMLCAAVVENGERKDIDPFDEASAIAGLPKTLWQKQQTNW